MPIATRAVTIGVRAANRAPKARPSTIRASTTPRTVLLEDGCGRTFSMAAPDSSTRSWGPSAAWAVRITALTALAGRFWAWASKVTVAKAIVPFRLTWLAPPGPYGLATLTTRGRWATPRSIGW